MEGLRTYMLGHQASSPAGSHSRTPNETVAGDLLGETKERVVVTSRRGRLRSQHVRS